MLELCVREIPSITFFGVTQEEMVNFHADLEDHFAKPKIMPGTRSSHFLPIFATKLLTNSQVRIESLFNLISTNNGAKKQI